MLKVILSVLSLLLGIGCLLVGLGALSTLLGVRAGIELFGPRVTGVVMAAYFLGFIVGNYLCPPLIRRVGHIRAFAAMAAIVTAAALLHALLVHPFVWFVLRIITGASMMGLYMVVESWLNAITPNERRGQVFAVYMTTTLLALAAGQYLITTGEISSTRPFALAAIFLALALVPIALTRIDQPVAVETPHLSLRTLFEAAPLGAAGALFAGAGTGAFWGMGPLFAHRIGLDSNGVALFMSITIAGGVLLQWPIGRLSDKSDRRRVLAIVSLFAIGTALVIYAFALYNHTLLYLFTFFYGGFAFTLYSLSVAIANDHLGREQVLEASRTLLLLHGIGAAAGPVLAGLLMAPLGPGALPLFFAAVLTPLAFYAVMQIRIRVPVIPFERFKPMTGEISQNLLKMMQRTDMDNNAKQPDDSPK